MSLDSKISTDKFTRPDLASDVAKNWSKPEKSQETAAKNTEQVSVQEAIASLKDDVVTQQTRTFLTNHGFDLEIETRTDALKLMPEFAHRKAIYEQMLFSQKNGARIILASELRKAFEKNPKIGDAELINVATKTINDWFATLATLDRNYDGKLNYEEITPDDAAEAEFINRVFGILPFCTELKHNPDFDDPTTKVTPEIRLKRIDFIKDYITRYAATLIDPKTNEPTVGSGRQLSRVLQSINLGVVGGVFLKNEDFGTMWGNLLDESNLAKDKKPSEKISAVAKVFSEGGEREQTKFTNLLEEDDLKIRGMRMDADQAMLDALDLEKSNPYGFMLRKRGDGKSIFIYNA